MPTQERPWTEATVTDWIRLSLYRQAGMAPVTYEELQRNLARRRCPDFKRARDARTRMGYLRYELLGSQNSLVPYTLASIRVLVERYQVTGNLEYLADIANLAELEWQHPSFEGTYFEGTGH